MKIIIYHKVSTAEKYSYLNTEKAQYVSAKHTIKTAINKHPNEDIGGLILPDAHENPEFADILQEIWMHKRELYNQTIPHPIADPVKFGKMIADKYGIVFAVDGVPGGKVTRIL